MAFGRSWVPFRPLSVIITITFQFSSLFQCAALTAEEPISDTAQERYYQINKCNQINYKQIIIELHNYDKIKLIHRKLLAQKQLF